MVKILNLIVFIVLVVFLATLNTLADRETLVYVAFILALYLNIYYFAKLFNPLKLLYISIPIVLFIFGGVFLFDAVTQLFKFSAPYYDVLNSITILIVNLIIISYFNQRLSQKTSLLLSYVFPFLWRYVLLAFPFFIAGANVSTGIRLQYTIGAVIYPLFYISVSILSTLFMHKRNNKNNLLEMLIKLIGRVLYVFAIFSAVVGVVNYSITWDDISYVTYDVMFRVLGSFNNTYPFSVMILIYLSIALLVFYIFWVLSYTDKFFKNNNISINIVLDGFLTRRLISIVFLVCTTYFLIQPNHIMTNFIYNYKVYDAINQKIQKAKLSLLPIPELDYSNATNVPRRNLAIIYLESMNEVNSENKYFDNLMPTLAKFKMEGVYFANDKQIYGQKNSASGIFSSQCGRFAFFERSNDNKSCLGNVLHGYGYYQEFVQGWPINSLYFNEMFKSFEYDRYLGYNELKDYSNKNDEAREKTGTPINKYFTKPDNINYGLGYTDKSVFEFAMGEFERLYENNTQKPFVITLFTADNHAPGGYSCNDSLSKYEGNGSVESDYQTVHCQDDLVRRYVEKIREIDTANNTAIIVIGDHLMHHSDKWHYVLKDDDRVYFTILNSGYKQQEIDNEVGHYDMAPIALDILGISQEEYIKNKSITKFMNGFDVLYGLQTNVGNKYIQERRVNALFDTFGDQDIASIRGRGVSHEISFHSDSKNMLDVMAHRNATFTSVLTSKDVDIDAYSSLDNSGIDHIFRMKFHNTDGDMGEYVRKNLEKLELTIKYDNYQRIIHYENIVSNIDYCDKEYCYFKYVDATDFDEHIKLGYVLSNKISGILNFDVKALGVKTY